MTLAGDRLVSIYMPTRNRVRLLGHAVDSVLCQTHRNIELIVVNDASTDDTESYLRRRASADPRLIAVSNATPRGAPASRNLAISMARGGFVTGLDDDDAFLPERIGAFLDYWTLLVSRGVRPACLYAQDVWMVDGARQSVTRKQSAVTADELFRYNYIGNQVFAPRDHFLGAGLFDETLPAWQDLEFLIRLLQRFGSAHLLDMPTYLFDVTLRPDRISSQERKIRQAFALVANKHAAASALREKTLFLQMFQEGYDIAPGLADWLRFIGWGHPRGLLGMVRATYAHRRSRRMAAPGKTADIAAPSVSAGGAVGVD
jgi:glycosyltransferase involved in cell wall biosynthesis